MAEVVQDTQREFWRSPTVLEPAVVTSVSVAPADVCGHCGTEFMIGASFCHACGLARAAVAADATDAGVMAGWWTATVERVADWAHSAAAAWRKFSIPRWMHHLHFHEIQRWVGLPTASLIAFIIGLGCVVGAIAVSLFYKASNLAEFEAIQMWRIEWLLAATSSFVCGILLKKPSRSDNQ